MDTGSVIESWPVVRVIWPVTFDWKTMLSAVGVVFACATASLRLPGSESLLLLTGMSTAWAAGAANAATPSAAPAPSPTRRYLRSDMRSLLSPGVPRDSIHCDAGCPDARLALQLEADLLLQLAD